MKTNESRITGIIGTLAVHALVIALLLLIVLRAPEHQDDESGMEVALGDVRVAKGSAPAYRYTPVEAVQPEVTPTPKAIENTAPPVKAEPLITQHDEESAPVETAEQIEARKKAEAEKKAAETAAAQMANAFGKSSQMEAKGTAEASEIGTQGAAEGNPTAQSASGNGIQGSWDLGGRSLVGSLPTPTENVQNEGRVVVNITVNAQGEVIGTSINVSRTNTSDANLRNAAERAAKRARFNNIGGGENQVGTIVYYFKLR